MKVFETNKPVIGVVHLKPLPGSPLYGGDYNAVLSAALADARVLVENGVDGLIIENFGDMPFYTDRVPRETVACMSAVSARIVRMFPGVPAGINVLRNDACSALAVAMASGARFIRTNVHVGVTTSEQGVITGKAHQVLRYRRQLDCRCRIFADIFVKHAYPLVRSSLYDTVCDTLDRGLADGLIVTGARTGAQPDTAFLKDVYQLTNDKNRPLWLGSGVNENNIPSLLPYADGVIVGTSLKYEGHTENSVDPRRVRRLVDKVKKERERL